LAVYIVDEETSTLSFKVAVDDIANFELQTQEESIVNENTIARRAFITSTVKIRLHQQSFRERVKQHIIHTAHYADCSMMNCLMLLTYCQTAHQNENLW